MNYFSAMRDGACRLAELARLQRRSPNVKPCAETVAQPKAQEEWLKMLANTPEEVFGE